MIDRNVVEEEKRNRKRNWKSLGDERYIPGPRKPMPQQAQRESNSKGSSYCPESL